MTEHTPTPWQHDRETGEHFLPINNDHSWKVYKTSAGDYALTLHSDTDGHGGEVEFFETLAQAKRAAIQNDRIAIALKVASRINAHDELVAALADVFAMMDEGYLVRDTSEDAEPGFAMRQLPYVQRLAKARAMLEAVQPANGYTRTPQQEQELDVMRSRGEI